MFGPARSSGSWDRTEPASPRRAHDPLSRPTLRRLGSRQRARLLRYPPAVVRSRSGARAPRHASGRSSAAGCTSRSSVYWDSGSARSSGMTPVRCPPSSGCCSPAVRSSTCCPPTGVNRTGLGVLCLYAAVAVAAAPILNTRRDGREPDGPLPLTNSGAWWRGARSSRTYPACPAAQCVVVRKGEEGRQGRMTLSSFATATATRATTATTATRDLPGIASCRGWRR
jgi:hypothetical protein